MIYCVPKRCGSLLLTALLALALPHAAQADDTCHLAKEGDCCAVTISPKTWSGDGMFGEFRISSIYT